MERTVAQITDERVLGTLAHPLRSRMVGLLRLHGPATATKLGQRLRESSGVTSYHLRKLAEVGLVEEDVDRGTRKERWWRAVHDLTKWSAEDFLGNPRAQRASVEMRRN